MPIVSSAFVKTVAFQLYAYAAQKPEQIETTAVL